MKKRTDKKRGAHFRLRCDKCGLFVWVGGPGGSSFRVPATDANGDEVRDRCPACTTKYGPLCNIT